MKLLCRGKSHWFAKSERHICAIERYFTGRFQNACRVFRRLTLPEHRFAKKSGIVVSLQRQVCAGG